jgi:hypothetical protein
MICPLQSRRPSKIQSSPLDIVIIRINWIQRLTTHKLHQLLRVRHSLLLTPHKMPIRNLPHTSILVSHHRTEIRPCPKRLRAVTTIDARAVWKRIVRNLVLGRVLVSQQLWAEVVNNCQGNRGSLTSIGGLSSLVSTQFWRNFNFGPV